MGGNQIEMTDALQRTTVYGYDAMARQTHVVFPDGTQQITTFDPLGRRIVETDQVGQTTHLGYDALGRLRSVNNALGQVTRYGYDEIGSLISQTDANNHTTTFVYDSMRRRISRTLPGGETERFFYDFAGNVTNPIDFNGRSTGFRYDAMDRLLEKIPDPFFGQPPVAFTYTPTGKRASLSDLSGVTLYQYNERDWLTNKATPQGTLSYSRDPHGNVLSIRSSNANGVSLSHRWDALNRLGTVTDATLGQTVYHYDPVGNLAGYSYPNGLSTTNRYDSLSRLTNLVTTTALNAPVHGYTYTLRPTGQRSSVQELSGRSVTYEYDDTYRLTRESIAGLPGQPSGTIDYVLDPVGNRLTRTSTVPGVASTSAAYDANDRLTTDTYDANGNTIAGQIEPGGPFVNDQYGFEDRLIARPAAQVQIVYDGDGNRVRETVAGTTTLYLVDEENPTGYSQVLEELTITNGEPPGTRAYVYGLDLISQDQLLAGDWVASFYGYDGHGTVRYLTDVSGNVQNTEDFEAFGVSIESAGTVPNNYRYAGEQFDSTLELYSLRARHLNVQSGRFWTKDLYEGSLRESLSLNIYIYVLADPVNGIDPSGYLGLFEELGAMLIDQVNLRATDVKQLHRARTIASKLCQISALLARPLNSSYGQIKSLLQKTGFQGHHVAQHSAMRDLLLDGYTHSLGFAIPLLGGSGKLGSPHEMANSYQREHKGQPIYKVAKGALLAAGCSEKDAKTIVNAAKNFNELRGWRVK